MDDRGNTTTMLMISKDVICIYAGGLRSYARVGVGESHCPLTLLSLYRLVRCVCTVCNKSKTTHAAKRPRVGYTCYDGR